MTTTLGIRRNTGREFKICTGHSKGIDPTWVLVKDHNDIRKAWLRTRVRLARMLKERAFAFRGVKKAKTATPKAQALKRKVNQAVGKVFGGGHKVQAKGGS
ncbi:hypothetical protein LCGC14_2011850 [marine sediment metagenome]|uniref:Uncharacterized protein n=1 Tax=marine sediment metagenome TaxID=412755 RepID=A0A0F9HDI8_9ZZZZ|nr:hypothetical protein [bacterium]